MLFRKAMASDRRYYSSFLPYLFVVLDRFGKLLRYGRPFGSTYLHQRLEYKTVQLGHLLLIKALFRHTWFSYFHLQTLCHWNPSFNIFGAKHSNIPHNKLIRMFSSTTYLERRKFYTREVSKKCPKMKNAHVKCYSVIKQTDNIFGPPRLYAFIFSSCYHSFSGEEKKRAMPCS